MNCVASQPKYGGFKKSDPLYNSLILGSGGRFLKK